MYPYDYEELTEGYKFLMIEFDDDSSDEDDEIVLPNYQQYRGNMRVDNTTIQEMQEQVKRKTPTQQHKARNKKARQQHTLTKLFKNPNMEIENIGDFESRTFNVEKNKSIQTLIEKNFPNVEDKKKRQIVNKNINQKMTTYQQSDGVRAADLSEHKHS